MSEMAFFFGLLVDGLYPLLGLSPRAIMGQAGELIPGWAQGAGAALLLVLSFKPLAARVLLHRSRRGPVPMETSKDPGVPPQPPDQVPACAENT
jgi:hypothetical protein